jgi:hypothetical protein
VVEDRTKRWQRTEQKDGRGQNKKVVEDRTKSGRGQNKKVVEDRTKSGRGQNKKGRDQLLFDFFILYTLPYSKLKDRLQKIVQFVKKRMANIGTTNSFWEGTRAVTTIEADV